MKIYTFVSAASLAAFLTVSQGHARQVDITAQLKNFSGPRAYASVYLTDPNGKLVDTLLVAGHKSKYYGHLRDWWRGPAKGRSKMHGVTGASVGSGGKLHVIVDIADNLIEAGYQIRVDASVEDRGDYPRSAVLTLGQQNKVNGRGLVHVLSLK